jgi:hypothetical protein
MKKNDSRWSPLTVVSLLSDNGKEVSANSMLINTNLNKTRQIAQIFHNQYPVGVSYCAWQFNYHRQWSVLIYIYLFRAGADSRFVT